MGARARKNGREAYLEVPATRPRMDRLEGDAITVILKARSSVRLLRNVSAVSKDFHASVLQARPVVLRHLARAGRQTAEDMIKDIMELNPLTQRLHLPTFEQSAAGNNTRLSRLYPRCGHTRPEQEQAARGARFIWKLHLRFPRPEYEFH